jgi:hypothetical protein
MDKPQCVRLFEAKGSLQYSAGKCRIPGHCLDTTCGAHLWLIKQ